MNNPPWVRISALIVVAMSMAVLTWDIALRAIDREYETKLRQGEERARDLASFFERDTRRILNIAEVYVFEALRIYRESGIDAVPAFTDTALANQDTVSHITIADADGTPVFVSGHAIRPGTTLADRTYFRQLFDAPDGASLVSLPYEGRNTGRLTVRLARRITDPDGSFGGVIFAAIHVDQFTAFFNTLNLGPRSSATLVGTDDKRIRARSSYGRSGPGQYIGKSRLWTELAARETGLYRQTSVVDGITRLYAYRKLSEYPLLLSIGLSEEDVFHDAEAFARPIYAIAGLTTLVILVLTTLLCRDLYTRSRMMREIAERRAAEAELARANTDLQQYAYSASHDLKAPLTSICGLLDFCLEDIESGNEEDLRQDLTKARAISRRSASKVESLLRIARSGSDPGELETFSLETLISEIWQDQTASKAGVCSLDLALSVDLVHSEKSSVFLILENLISNAIRYRDADKDRATLRIESTREENGIVLSVSDNGVGIPADFQGRIFDSFASFDDRGGDGLGLSLVRKHVMRLGGSIDVTSSVGSGTTFRIVLPSTKVEQDDNSGGGGGRQRDRSVHAPAPAVAC